MDQILGQAPAARVEEVVPPSSSAEESAPQDANPPPPILPHISSPIVQDPNLTTIPESQPSPVLEAEQDAQPLKGKVTEDASFAHVGSYSMNGDLMETQVAPGAVEEVEGNGAISIALEEISRTEDDVIRADLVESYKAAEFDPEASVVSVALGSVLEQQLQQVVRIADEPVMPSPPQKLSLENINPSPVPPRPITSYSYLESTAGASSSPAIAQNLLNRKSPGEKAFQSLTESFEQAREVEPPSSADPDMSASQFGIGKSDSRDEMEEKSSPVDSVDAFGQDGLEDDDYTGDQSGDTLRGPTVHFFPLLLAVSHSLILLFSADFYANRKCCPRTRASPHSARTPISSPTRWISSSDHVSLESSAQRLRSIFYHYEKYNSAT